MKVALYVRVSTEEQRKHGLSVDNQIEALYKYAEDKGYEVVSLYNDAGHSARKRYKTRPELLRLIEDVKLNKFDLILFTKLDRWFRNVADYHEVQAILDQHNVKWQAIWEDYETITSSGVFKVNIMLSVAQNEADKTSERVRESVNYRKSQGRFIGGHAPTGYKLEGKEIVKDEESAPGVKIFFDTLIRYGSITKAMYNAHAKGLHITYDIAQRMRSHPAYYGGEYYHTEPYITKEQYDMIQIKGRAIETKHIFIFSRIVRCSCGHIMTGQITPYKTVNGDVNEHVYYYCKSRNAIQVRHKMNMISEKKIEKFLLENLENLLKAHKENLFKLKPIDNKKIDQDKFKLKEKLRRIGDRYEDGDIDRKEYTQKRQAVLQELKALDEVSTPTFKDIQLPTDWKEVYNSLSSEYKNVFWKSILKEIRVYQDKTFDIIFL